MKRVRGPKRDVVDTIPYLVASVLFGFIVWGVVSYFRVLVTGQRFGWVSFPLLYIPIGMATLAIMGICFVILFDASEDAS